MTKINKNFVNLMLKIFLFLFLLLNSNLVFSNSNKNFELALKNALNNSAELISAKYSFDSKKKLILNAYAGKDWNSSFTSSLSLNNKKYDHTGSFLDETTNLNIISIKKKLFDGGLTENEVEIALNNFNMEKNKFLLVEQKILFETIRSYLNLYKSNKILKLRSINVDKFFKHVNASKLKLKAGTITPTTVAEAEARLARSEYELVLAKTERDNYKNEFFSIVGEDFNVSGLELPVTKFSLPNTKEEAISLAFINSPLILNNQIKKNISLLERNKRISANRPSLDIDFQYKYSESSSSNSSSDYSSYGTVLTFKTPLFYNKSEKNLILSLDDKYKSIVQEKREVHRNVKLNVSSSYNNYKNSFLNTKAATKELRAAKLALKGVQKEEEYGIRTLLEVLDNEVNVVNAEVNILKSKCNEILQKFNLKKQIGTLIISDVVVNFKVKYPNEKNFTIPSLITF